MNLNEYYKKLKVVETTDRPFTKYERLEVLGTPILEWYQEHKRILPWREHPTAYGVWISEIMLQQTRVEAVKPYFERFIRELPSVAVLANIDEERLLKLWEGLGYYNRARNLKKAAQIAVSKYGGHLPTTYDELLTLPGIGSYTAGAIASIAYKIPVPAVDGNVLRVISRIMASHEDISKQSVKTNMEQDLKMTMPKDNASEYNQALMELGATVCIPNGQAKCNICPLFHLCLANKQGIVMELPIKAPKKSRRLEDRTIFVIESATSISIHKRSAKGLLAGLYELPNVLGHLTEDQVKETIGIKGEDVIIEVLPQAKHIFSHVEWHMTGFRIILKNEQFPTQYLTVEKETVKSIYPLPNAFRAYMEQINF